MSEVAKDAAPDAAPDTAQSEPGAADPEADEDRIRSLRRSAWLIGVPLSLALVVPWSQRRDVSFSWDFAERADHWGFVLVPLCGVLVLVAAIAPRWTHRRRAVLFAVAGFAALLIGASMLSSPALVRMLRPIRNMWVTGAYLFVGCWVSAVAFEVAMHQRPRSLGLTRLALVGWLAVCVGMCIPMHYRLDFDESMLGAALELSDRHIAPFLILMSPAVVALVGIIQAARRLGSDREAAAKRRFRTSWLAYLIMPIPLVALATIAIGLADRFDQALGFFVGFSFALGTLAAPAIGGGHLLAAVSRSSSWRKQTLRGAAAVAAAITVAAVVLKVVDGRDKRIAELSWTMAETVAAALEGKPVDPRFLGGYAEFDLRSAEGVIPLDEGAELEPLLFAVRVLAQDDGRTEAYLITLPDGSVGWRPATGSTYNADEVMLERASPVLLDMIGRTAEGGCLPEVSVPAIAERVVGTGPVCGDDRESALRGRRFSDGGGVRGNVDQYVLVVRTPSGEEVAIEGALRPDTGRLWIGAPQVVGQGTESDEVLQ